MLTKADRAELCRRADLPALMEADGIEIRRAGAGLVCKLRPDEKNPSCHIYAPGTGKRGAEGWTFHDYGGTLSGDALAYMVDVRGMPFADAAQLLINRTGYTPAGWKGTPQDRPAGKPAQRTAPAIAAPPPPPPMPQEWQLDAAAAFMLGIDAAAPDAANKGEAYLARRGCLPAGMPPPCWVLEKDDLPPLAALLLSDPDAEALARAGILITPADGKPARLAWWDRVALLGCYNREGVLAYYIARRLDWKTGDAFGKYINQPTAGGAVRMPFNLPALYAAAGRLPAWPVQYARRELLLVEGPLDALGAGVLGWPAVALLNRPQARRPDDDAPACCRMLEANLAALLDCPRVLIVPDADAGPKGAEGEALAARLVGWMRRAGIKADLAPLADLLPLPADCKDLADVAAKERTPPQ